MNCEVNGILTFDQDSHVYKLDGVVLPSVTGILRYTGVAPNYDDVDREVLKRAAWRGAAVHKACELIDKGEEIDDSIVHESIRPYLAAYRSFLSEVKPRILSTELQMYHRDRLYAGTVDLIGKINGSTAVLDRKCTAWLYDSTGVQCAAYSTMAEYYGYQVRDLYGLQLKGDGSYVLRKFDFKESLEIWECSWRIFSWAMNAYKQ